MAVRKPKQPTAEQRADELRQADRARRSRTADPKWDRGGVYFDRCAELAQRLGLDVTDVYEEHCERAAVRHFCGAASVDEAEAGAWVDVEQRYTKQMRIE